VRERREAAFLVPWPQRELAGEPHRAGGSEDGQAGGALRLSGQVLLERVQRCAVGATVGELFSRGAPAQRDLRRRGLGC
jgi:hypothetical protein